MAEMSESTLAIMEDHDQASGTALFKHHRELVRWITEDNINGYLHPEVRIAHNHDKGFHMVVADGCNIPALTRIISSPMTATLSVLNALDVAPFKSYGSKFPLTFLRNNANKPELLQAFFLMDQYVKGDKSWWAPYIKTLPSPRDVQELQFESKDDHIWLEGTNLKSAFITQTTKWQEMYTKGKRELMSMNWQPALDGSFSWELFRWAATIFGSRSFTSEVLSDTEPADQARMQGRHGVQISEHAFLKPLFMDRFAVLLPLLDILNHRPIAQVEWQARCSFVGMQVLDSFVSGEELCNNYGPRDNESLLLSYGFTIANNPFDHLAIALKPPPPDSPLTAARNSWKQDLRSTQEYKSYIFSIAHPRASSEQASCLEASIFSYDLLDALSILKGNDRELQAMHIMRQTLMSSSLAKQHKFEDFRNFLAVLSQLHLDCKAKSERLRSTRPATLPKTSKQCHAKVYRDSQLAIAEAGVAVCQFVLARACTDRVQATIMTDLQKDSSATAIDSLQALMTSHRLITRRNELLTVNNILESLPDSAVTTYRTTMECVESRLFRAEAGRRKKSPSTSPSKRKRSPNQPQPEAKISKTSPSLTNGEFFKTKLTASSTQTSVDFQLANRQPPDANSSTKSQFSVLLAMCLHQHLRGVKLPNRLKSWLDQVTSWYPPDDPYWNYVPHDGPYEAGEEPPEALMELLRARSTLIHELKSMVEGEDLLSNETELKDSVFREKNRGIGTIGQWLTPERLCWGWNVMEEEGVVVSKEILKLARGTSEEETESQNDAGPQVDFLLYCKQ